jgi:hypothetical protein
VNSRRDDAHDLTFGLVAELFHDASADDKARVKRIVTFDPVLPGHRLIDDDHRRTRLIVPVCEGTATLDRNLEDIEISRRDRQPSATTVIRARPVWLRPSDNPQWKAVAPSSGTQHVAATLTTPGTEPTSISTEVGAVLRASM